MDLAQHVPHAQLVVSPGAGHGALFRYPRLFCAHVARFLDSQVPFT
ncbi:alpha/beta fold hydrolase [Actinacidiphila glaucinigra]|nr:hypothetical protein [Streptomyces sp. PA03-3a]